MTNPLVIDLSHWNPTPDWNVLKSNGTVGVIHKATEGTSYVDDMLFSRAEQAMAAGLCWSTYHFFHGEGDAEMRHYLDTVNPRQGERVCIDHEASATIEELRDAVRYLIAHRPDLQITIYSGHLIKDQLGSSHDALLAENTSLWIAHYTNSMSPTWPVNTWPMWSLWQYTDSETVEGVSSPVDANHWNGNEEHLIEWFGPAGEVVPVPEPAMQICDISINTTPGVTVSITLNGDLVLASKLV